MNIAETDETFVVKRIHHFYFSLKCIAKISQPIRYFTIFTKIFDAPIKRGQKIWYPAKNSSTPVPSFQNECSLMALRGRRYCFAQMTHNEVFRCIISYPLNIENKHFITFEYIWIIDKRDRQETFMITFIIECWRFFKWEYFLCEQLVHALMLPQEAQAVN